MPDNAPNLNAFRAAAVAEELVRLGIEWCCIAPGSRSTPLAWALGQHSGLKTVVHFDERGLAFHALGIGAATGKPAVFVCTSGTAVANALPAVVEASQSRVPMLLLTADRPPELQGRGANQTIHQPGIYGGYVRWESELAFTNAEPDGTRAILATLHEAVHRATAAPPGPVHLNVPLREPLGPSVDTAFNDREDHAAAVADWVAGSSAPGVDLGYTPTPEEARDQAIGLLISAKQGVLLLGQLASDAERSAAKGIAKHLGWPVYADVTSGFRFGGIDGLVPYFSRLGLAPDAASAHAADVILHLGGAIVAKDLPVPLAENAAVVRVADTSQNLDPWDCVTHRIQSPLEAFADAVLRQPRPQDVDTEWRSELQERSKTIESVIEKVLEAENTLNEIATLYLAIASARQKTTVFLANSMPIRDADFYAPSGGGERVIAANRGASGIDGNVATALGHARGTGQPVIAVIGDLATLHDLNSLALAKDLDVPITVIAINNDGGGIFSMLPIAEHGGPFEKLFGTPHGLALAPLAESFGWKTATPRTIEEFADALRRGQEHAGPTFIEVHTRRDENAVLHRKLNEAIRAALT